MTLRAAEINDKKFEAELTKIPLSGTIVWTLIRGALLDFSL